MQIDNCKTCLGENCNLQKEYQQCIQCNSRENIECAQNGTVQTSQVCEDYLSTCVTGIDAQGYTHRRCSRFDDEAHFKQMSPCNTSNCNTDIFPPNRLQCYRCDGDEENCDFMPTNTSTELKAKSMQLVPCGLINPFDKCYTYHSESKCLSILRNNTFCRTKISTCNHSNNLDIYITYFFFIYLFNRQ